MAHIAGAVLVSLYCVVSTVIMLVYVTTTLSFSDQFQVRVRIPTLLVAHLLFGAGLNIVICGREIAQCLERDFPCSVTNGATAVHAMMPLWLVIFRGFRYR
jgi:hypothetical protein